MFINAKTLKYNVELNNVKKPILNEQCWWTMFKHLKDYELKFYNNKNTMLNQTMTKIKLHQRNNVNKQC